MESGEGFASVMDHGVEVSIEHLPKIPCTKFTMIGNSHMRNKKPILKKEQMWNVPKSLRRRQSEQEKNKPTNLNQSLRVHTKTLEPKFGNQEELNRFDKNGIYGDAFQRTLDLTKSERNQKLAPRHREAKVEKKYIDDFYRDKSSLFLPRYDGKSAPDAKSQKFGRHVPLPSLLEGRTEVTKDVTRSCQGNARHYCDVVGQRYCTACLRVHRLDKLAHRASEARSEPSRKSKSKLATALPKLRAISFFEKGVGRSDATSDTNNLTRTKSSPLLSQKEVHGSRTWERMGDMSGNSHGDRKRRKVSQRTSVLPNSKIPTLSDITTDTDSRHLTT